MLVLVLVTARRPVTRYGTCRPGQDRGARAGAGLPVMHQTRPVGLVVSRPPRVLGEEAFYPDGVILTDLIPGGWSW